MLCGLDFLGCESKLYINSSTAYATKFGGCVTIILALIMSVLFLLFGRDFYYRVNPTVITELGTYTSYPIFNLDSSNFTLALGIEDYASVVWRNDTEVFIDMHLVSFEYSNEYAPYNETIMNLIPCEERHFFYNSSENAVRFKNHMCYDFNGMRAGGFWDSNYVYYFYLSVNICLKGNLSPRGDPCAEQISRIFDENNYYFSIYMQQYTVNPTDYVNPMKWGIKNYYFLIDKNIQKNYRFNFIETIIKSDYGWLFETLNTISVLSLDFIEFDVSSISHTDSRIANTSIYFSKKYVYYSRSYSKIQTLAANVGGVMKLFIFIGILIVKKYNMFYMNKELAQAITQESKPSKDIFPCGITYNFPLVKLNNLVSASNHTLDRPSKNSKLNLNQPDNSHSQSIGALKTSRLIADVSLFEYYRDQIFKCCRKSKDREFSYAEDIIKFRMDSKELIKRQIQFEELFSLVFGDSSSSPTKKINV